jgi:cobalamin biosynthetic protein CobC
MLHHGGALIKASKQYAIPLAQWIDLSTGINPCGWTVPAISPNIWLRLPEADDGLIEAAVKYYGAASLLPIAGSQPAIQTLPKLRIKSNVGIFSPSYAEHEFAWTKAGHQIVRLERSILSEKTELALKDIDVLIVCNPNNPTGRIFTPDKLLEWHHYLQHKNGWLIVDETFVDPTPELSMVNHTGRTGLIVLRSLSKFFGLAGARIGFVVAWKEILSKLEEEFGPWSVSGPARYIAKKALADHQWQKEARFKLNNDSTRLGNLLSRYNFRPTGSIPHFQYVEINNAHALYEHLASSAILTRYFSNPNAIRIGLPADESVWQRLEQALLRFQHSEVVNRTNSQAYLVDSALS